MVPFTQGGLIEFPQPEPAENQERAEPRLHLPGIRFHLASESTHLLVELPLLRRTTEETTAG